MPRLIIFIYNFFSNRITAAGILHIIEAAAGITSIVDFWASNTHEEKVQKGYDNISKILSEIATALSLLSSGSVKDSSFKTVFGSGEDVNFKSVSGVDMVNARTFIQLLFNFFGSRSDYFRNGILSDLPNDSLSDLQGLMNSDSNQISKSIIDLKTSLEKIYTFIDNSFSYTENGIKKNFSDFFYYRDDAGNVITFTDVLKNGGLSGADSSLADKFKININGNEYSITEVIYNSLNLTQNSDFDGLVNNITFQIGDKMYSLAEIIYNCLNISQDDNFKQNITDILTAVVNNSQFLPLFLKFM